MDALRINFQFVQHTTTIGRDPPLLFASPAVGDYQFLIPSRCLCQFPEAQFVDLTQPDRKTSQSERENLQKVNI